MTQTHASDCAVHNAPAQEPKKCDCWFISTNPETFFNKWRGRFEYVILAGEEDEMKRDFHQAQVHTRKQALQDAAKVICPQCADGRPIDNKGNHTAKEGGTILLPPGPCIAQKIHKILADITSQETDDADED